MVKKHEQEASEDTLFTISISALLKGRKIFLYLGIASLVVYSVLFQSFFRNNSGMHLGETSVEFHLSALVSNNTLLPFIGITLILFAFIGFSLWAFFAKETLIISHSEVSLSKTVFGIGHTYHLDPDTVTKTAYIPSTKHISHSKPHQSYQERSFYEGKIAIICNGRTYTFARALTDQKAAELADTIERHIRSIQGITAPSQISQTHGK